MAVEKINSVLRGEEVLSGRIIIDQIEASISFYDTRGNRQFMIQPTGAWYSDINFSSDLGSSITFGGAIGSFNVHAGYAEVGSVSIDTNGMVLDRDGENEGIFILSDGAMSGSRFELNGSEGVKLPRIDGNNTIVQAGYIWLDMTANVLKYRNSAGTIKTITAT